ncbi:hypothetical protein M5K25_028199 [Dendrobium thyrsiflorum]|uniref:Uncharacterized protein n=1 Tax=Dendrobium thyrsiflorum TaxID=117978 RepID=A0ABD0TU77_DENTH
MTEANFGSISSSMVSKYSMMVDDLARLSCVSDTVALPCRRGSPDFYRSSVRPQNENLGPCAGVSSLRLACSVWSAPWFLECQPQRGMPSTRALFATNHSLAGRSGSAFQVRYPNRLLCSTGSLAPSSILSTALLLGSLLLQPLAVIACLLGGSHPDPGWGGAAEPEWAQQSAYVSGRTHKGMISSTNLTALTIVNSFSLYRNGGSSPPSQKPSDPGGIEGPLTNRQRGTLSRPALPTSV